jgi:hypothetical protein
MTVGGGGGGALALTATPRWRAEALRYGKPVNTKHDVCPLRRTCAAAQSERQEAALRYGFRPFGQAQDMLAPE